MSKIAQNFTLRLILAFTVCTSLLLLPGVSLLSEASRGQRQGAGRDARPRPRKPEGTLPDLEDVKKESKVEREAPPPIPSTVRAKRNEGKPWDGRRVGDPETPNRLVDQPDEGRLTRRAHARRRATPPLLNEDQFIQNFFSLALLHSASPKETLHWNDLLRAGYNQNQTSLKLAAIELGRTLFESASYLARNRDAHFYVYDLYKTYLMREPDAGGWAYWEALVPTHGREYVRRGFEESGEFANLLATVSLTGSASATASSLITARTDPRNQPGNGMLSRDVKWSVSLLSLPGRNGLDLGLALSYSSMVWTRSGPYFYFDEDNGFPSPGFRLGFPTVQRKTFDAQTGKIAYLLITSAGHRVELRQTTSPTVYEAADSSYLQLTEMGGTLLVRSTDGTQLTFVDANNEYRCTQVKDRNGNYISVNYNTQGQITNITDTLGRVITFNYDSNANLISITQAWHGQASHQWVSFGWSTPNMEYSFADTEVIGIKNGTAVPVLTQVALNDTSHFTFEYTNPLQVSVIKNYFGAIERNATTFGYETPAGDVPRLNSSSVSAQNWTGVNGMPAQITTQYDVALDGTCVMTAPDGTIYKEYYGSGWQKGLTTLSEIWSGGVRQKWTTTAWTQDNTSVSYETNPRVTETNVYDASGNRRRTVIDYGQYANWGLPYLVKEYAANGDTEVRRTFTDYNLSQTYLDRRIIGLVSAVHLTNVSSFQGKITYEYDDPARLTALPASATQHDSSYNASFTARGNLTSVSRWDFNDINNASKKLTSYTNYFVSGSPASATDPSTHTSTISYADAFSDEVDRPSTFAYPTTMTDADGHSSTVQYNFDFGATTRTQSPAPANQTQGTIQTMAYNSLGQLERVITTNNDAYKRFWYGANYVASYATVNNVADELYAIQVVDGLGRVIGATSNHPGSNGGYSLVSIIYDQMGRLWKQSNPTEIDSSWLVSGDDAAGIYYTQQTYDWKGRPLVTTNTDLTTKTAAYSGCGCAGGEVVTLTDEGTIDAGVVKRRKQKIYSDVFGRTVKTELFNWEDGGVYSTIVNTYNVRDQLTQEQQYAGEEGSGTYQETAMTYDGYGRMKTKHVPQQQVDPNNSASTDHTTWDYNPDGTVQKVTDARGAVANFTYNDRHLVTGISYTLLSGVPTNGPSAVAQRSPESFNYDAAGNRTLASDGSGETTYAFDQLSRLTSESRTFANVSGSYALNYSYNRANQPTSITIPLTSQQIGYSYDAAARLSSISASGFQAWYWDGSTQVSQPITSFVSHIAYRAWGARKTMTYGNTTSDAISYNARMQPATYTVNNVSYTNYMVWPNTSFTSMTWNFDYFADGRLNHAYDTTHNFWDRSYTYDHMGRLKQANTNRRARGQAPQVNAPDPYQQTYTYDVFNHQNVDALLYSGGGNDVGTYVNNRRQGWGYDADGNTTDSTNYRHSFDAGGRYLEADATQQVGDGEQFPHQPRIQITQTYDSDGGPRKRVQVTRRNIYDEVNEEHPITAIDEETLTIYYLRSSVLGGAQIMELAPNGSGGLAGGMVWVYANGERIAQGYMQNVTFEHHNPATGSWVTSLGHSNARYAGREERDPRGAELPLWDTNPAPSYVEDKWGEPLFIDGGDPYDYSTGRQIDGLPVTEAEFQRRVGNDSIRVQRTNRDGSTQTSRIVANYGSGIWVDKWETEYTTSGVEFPLQVQADGSVIATTGPSVTISATDAGHFVTVSDVALGSQSRNQMHGGGWSRGTFGARVSVILQDPFEGPIPPTNCEMLQNTTAVIATRDGGTAATIRDLRSRFVEAPGQPPTQEFRSSGFKGIFRDFGYSPNQVRHYVGILSNAYLGALRTVNYVSFEAAYVAGLTAANFRERGNTQSNLADRNLNVVAVGHGVRLAYGGLDINDLARAIQEDVCDP